MDFRKLSDRYDVRRLGREDVERIYLLSAGNPLFYQYCPPFVTRQSICQDMEALPPGKSPEDKFYLGFFREGELLAVMDLVLGYPDRDTAYIGLFMMDQRYQGQGIGSEIITQCVSTLKVEKFRCVRLAYAKGNHQSRSFWRKNHFAPTGEESLQEGYIAVLMERELL